MNILKPVLISSSLLLLAGCAPGNYNTSNGHYYPTPKNETVQPWQMTTVHPHEHAQRKAILNPEEEHAKEQAQHQSAPKGPAPNSKDIVSPS